jgi:hypothetical protein
MLRHLLEECVIERCARRGLQFRHHGLALLLHPLVVLGMSRRAFRDVLSMCLQLCELFLL